MDRQIKKLCRDVMIIFGVGILLVLVIFLGIIPWAEGLEKPAYLDVLIDEGVKVEIDGQEYRNGVYEMEPGEYRAVASVEGMENLVLDLNLVKNQTAGVYLGLRDGKWKQWTVEELVHRQAIAEVMPINFAVCGENATRMNCDAVTVTYEYACKGRQCIVITGRKSELTDETLNKAKEELKSRNYNLDDYQYVYVQNVNR